VLAFSLAIGHHFMAGDHGTHTRAEAIELAVKQLLRRSATEGFGHDGNVVPPRLRGVPHARANVGHVRLPRASAIAAAVASTLGIPNSPSDVRAVVDVHLSYAQAAVAPPRRGVAVKKVLELLLCILHPIAVVLIWINLALRRDLGLIAKLTWAIAAIVPFVPFVYVLTGNDFI
jgi:hypothetical protein